MEEYKKSVDAQHAPEALITKTLQKIHEEERGAGVQAEVRQSTKNKAQPKKSRRRYAWIVTAAGMAAVLAVVVGVSSSNRGLTYNIVQESQIRAEAEISLMPEHEMTAEEYGAYLGRDLTEPLKGVTLSKADISVAYGEDGETILEDEGTFYYNTGSGQVMVKMSKTTEVAPEELLSGEATEWHGLTVYAGENETQDKRLAALQQGDIRYFVMSYGMSEKEFEIFLKNFF